MTGPRAVLLRLHRYAGLTLAAFLLLAGPTGSVAAFHDELDGLLNPDLFRAAHRGSPLPPSVLARRLLAAVPDGRLGFLVYRPAPGDAVRAFLQPRPGAAHPLPRDEWFLDPVTGAPQGGRDSGGCCFRRRALIPFLYRFHYTLGLGRTGTVAMGIAAMLWALDCVVGLLLTLPPRAAPWRAGSWRRWGRAWRVKSGVAGIRRVFDLHRAVSLWLWIVLLGLAVSGVALALPGAVFDPAVALLLPTTPPLRPPATASAGPAIGLDQADAIAARVASAAGWHGRPGSLYRPGDGTLVLFFDGSGGHRAAGLGGPQVTLDDAGHVLLVTMPGGGRAGDVVRQLQMPWHSGALAGLPGRIAIALCGLAVPMLVVTGLLIWDRKRRPRRARRPRPV